MQLMDKGFALDAEVLIQDTPESEELRQKLFGNPRYIRVAGKYLRFLEKRGFLDI